MGRPPKKSRVFELPSEFDLSKYSIAWNANDWWTHLVTRQKIGIALSPEENDTKSLAEKAREAVFALLSDPVQDVRHNPILRGFLPPEIKALSRRAGVAGVRPLVASDLRMFPEDIRKRLGTYLLSSEFESVFNIRDESWKESPLDVATVNALKVPATNVSSNGPHVTRSRKNRQPIHTDPTYYAALSFVERTIPWACVVDLEQTDTALKKAFATWLERTRRVSLTDSFKRPNFKPPKELVELRVLPALDLRLYGLAAHAELGRKRVLESLWPPNEPHQVKAPEERYRVT